MVHTILLTRHGYRADWDIPDAQSPTLLPHDPPLAPFGRQQAQELASHIKSIERNKVDQIYASPFYRCLETADALAQALNIPIFVEPGIGEWYGVTRTFYPQPAKVEELVKHFPNIDSSYVATMEFPQGGETMEYCHSRVEACVNQILSRLDASPYPVGTVVFVCHAASMICLGRALLKDSKAFIPSATCSCSTFKRQDASAAWTMHNEGDTSFLSGGEQHAWQFEGDVPNYERTSGGPPSASPTTAEPQTVSPALSADMAVP